MTRIAVSAALLLMTTTAAHAQEDPQLIDGLSDAAAESGVAEQDLLGALNSLADAGVHTTPRAYLCAADGLLCPPAPAVVHTPIGCGLPICGPMGQRIYCVEGIESTHGAHMYNPTLWHGEHAQGWLGFLPSTARRWGAAIGNRASEWQAAASMIRGGAGGQFAGIAGGTC